MTRILRFLFLGLGGFVVMAVANAVHVGHRDEEEPEVEPAGPDWDPGAPERQPLRPKVPRRFLTTFAVVCLFFAGASLVAGAGDQAAKLIQGEESAQAIADGASTDPAAQPDASATSDPAAPADGSGSADATAPPADPTAPAVEAPSDPSASSSDPASDPAAGDAAPVDPATDPAATDPAATDPAASDSGASGDVRPHASRSADASGAPAPAQAAQRV